MSERHVPYITIDNQDIYQGDYVVAKITDEYVDDDGDAFDEISDVIGRIHITDNIEENKITIYICQHQFNGADIENKYGYPFSWHAGIDTTTGEIITGDTKALRKATYEEVVEHLAKENYYLRAGQEPAIKVQDDDPMPDDWKYEETLPF